MRRTAIALIRTALFVCAFLSSAWHFLDWRSAGQLIMSTASSRLASSGTRIAWSDVTGTDGGFTVHNLAVQGAADAAFQSLTIRPQLLQSLLNMAASCSLSFTGGRARLGMTVDFGNGGVEASVSPSAVELSDIHTDGEFSLTGWLALSPQAMRITNADALVRVPSAMEGNMSLLQSFLPLVNEGGSWYLRR